MLVCNDWLFLHLQWVDWFLQGCCWRFISDRSCWSPPKPLYCLFNKKADGTTAVQSVPRQPLFQQPCDLHGFTQRVAMATFQQGWPVSFPIAAIISVIIARPVGAAWPVPDAEPVEGTMLHPAPSLSAPCPAVAAAIRGLAPQNIGRNKCSYWEKD